MYKRIVATIFICVLAFLLAGTACYLWIDLTTKKFNTYNLYSLPKCHAALVPGTSRRLSSGLENLYFTNRMKAAALLFRTERVKRFILSGDNRANNYNEPKQMKKALLALGIPDSCLVQDYAGLRTFDSMVRCKEIFGQDTVIVVSQEFHNARAIFIGRKFGMEVFGYNADRVTTQNTTAMRLREFVSRIRCVLDLYLLDTRPRHLGEKINID